MRAKPAVYSIQHIVWKFKKLNIPSSHILLWKPKVNMEFTVEKKIKKGYISDVANDHGSL